MWLYSERIKNKKKGSCDVVDGGMGRAGYKEIQYILLKSKKEWKMRCGKKKADNHWKDREVTDFQTYFNRPA